MRKIGNSLVVLITVFVVCSGHGLSARESWDGVERIVAIGDIHGDYDQMFSLLKSTGLVSQSGKWTGGKTHLVQTGDIPDRGPDTARIIRFFMRLEKQARRKGGYVHLLVGNHEAMNMSGDLRYVVPEEYAAFKTRKSGQLQDRYYAANVVRMRETLPPKSLPVFDVSHREQWDKIYPPGYVEHRRAWAATGEFGSWVSKHNAVIRINNILFMHGGLGPAYSDSALKQINDAVDKGLMNVPPTKTPEGTEQVSIVVHTEGPLWYRGLARNAEDIERDHLASILELHGAQHIVLGHTVTEGAIKPRFGGSVILIDVGMSAHYGSHSAALVIKGDAFFVVHRGQKMPLPFSGDELIEYFETVAALEPDRRRLDQYISTLKQAGDPVIE